jgi:hypothetical protein
MPFVLSTISPSKKLEPSADTVNRNLSKPNRPSSALVTKPVCSVSPRSPPAASLFMV